MCLSVQVLVRLFQIFPLNGCFPLVSSVGRKEEILETCALSNNIANKYLMNQNLEE